MEKELKKVLRTARLLWWGVILQACLFALWGVNLFLTAEQPTTEAWWPYVLFSIMGLLTTLYGIKFFHNFSQVRRQEILSHEPKKRRETLLMISVIHFLLLEFVCVLGILLAVFLQKKQAVYPFFVVSMIGLAFSFPTKEWFRSFFQDAASESQ